MKARTEDPLNMIISGIGGQGNILLSRLIGRVLAVKGYHLTIGETFGAAQRGGSVFSSMRISSEKDYGPLIPEGRGHVILSLEPLETLRTLTVFGNPEVLTVTNMEPIYPVGVLSKRARYPELGAIRRAITNFSGKSWFLNATEVAVELQAPMTANIVMLGALTGIGAIPVTLEEVEEEVRKSFPREIAAVNIGAVKRGNDLVREQEVESGRER